MIGYSDETNADGSSIIIGRVGSYCGSLYFSKYRCWVTDNAIRATAKDDNDARFAYYLLCTLNLNNMRAGSGQPLLNQSILSSVDVLVPLPTEQRAISTVLGVLDDKIELNRRMNETLEAVARALFKSWFVDFDPIRTAAAAGSQVAEISGGISAPSPSEFAGSHTPMGWSQVPIRNACQSILSGGTPSTGRQRYWGGPVPWLSSGETRDRFICATQRTITQEGVENSSTRFARKGSTVIASAGQGNTRGQTSMLLIDSYVNQSVIALTANTQLVSDVYLFFDLERRYEEFRRLSDSQSSRGSLTTRLVSELQIVVPPPELIRRFDDIVGPMVSRIEVAIREISTLASLRDSLLPRLISGELRVKSAERIVGGLV